MTEMNRSVDIQELLALIGERELKIHFLQKELAAVRAQQADTTPKTGSETHGQDEH